MKIPNLPSWYHRGTWNFSSDDHCGANGPRATTASTWRTASATRASWGVASTVGRNATRTSAAVRRRIRAILGLEELRHHSPEEPTASLPRQLAMGVRTVGVELEHAGERSVAPSLEAVHRAGFGIRHLARHPVLVVD